MLMPDVVCRRCGKPPALRIPLSERNAKRHVDDDQLILTYKCTHCGEMYAITAKAYKGAA